ncbi:peptide deformylase, mitochondrial [Calliopsis andreniformis]|uniref:peptide deformylase, mitochondrial n=1 Tax=Calliopsis andreniformis TaxID=337506 RepID=UPI003FCD433B
MIVTTFKCGTLINRCLVNITKNSVRSITMRGVKQAFINRFRSEFPHPPYDHICQVGDPVLRTKATPVDPNTIQTKEFQKALEHLCKVLRKYEMVGLAAPQIGLSWQVFAVELTEKELKKFSPKEREIFEIEAIPLTFFINPKMEIKPSAEVTSFEICGSVAGFRGQVTRAKEVEIKALNRLGDAFTWQGKGWSARIVQHEFDHLQGKLYTDKMDPTTFECCLWEAVNLTEGEAKLKYYPK